ncbi:MAG: protein-(glutamine-N5) methyltransferase, release factor-specific [Porphyromonadaceae bacterium CG2_30_38_12]|nr:MAG: protein-(glutamine-N5) methyltransferase, release factor-specific [Porphyromonadaceae bacterium CG2_30_38_12]
MQQNFENIRTALRGYCPENEINSIAKLVLMEVSGYTFTELILNKNTIFSAIQQEKVKYFVDKLTKREPIQYVLGRTEFYGLQFQVNPSVLIPRPETEELVDWVRISFSTQQALRLLDIGTGSGCIAISLKSIFAKSEVTAYDISDAALETARQNAKINDCEIDFRQVDILYPPFWDTKWDSIVSNPPYIPKTEQSELSAHVLDFEPHTALFVPDSQPLIFYEAIAGFALQHLNSGGMLFLEIHRDFGHQIVQLLEKSGFKEVILRKDLSGNDRMVRARV